MVLRCSGNYEEDEPRSVVHFNLEILQFSRAVSRNVEIVVYLRNASSMVKDSQSNYVRHFSNNSISSASKFCTTRFDETSNETQKTPSSERDKIDRLNSRTRKFISQKRSAFCLSEHDWYLTILFSARCYTRNTRLKFQCFMGCCVPRDQ